MAVKLGQQNNEVRDEEEVDPLLAQNNEEPERKFFANKKANIALGIVAAVFLVGFIGGYVYINFIMK